MDSTDIGPGSANPGFPISQPRRLSIEWIVEGFLADGKPSLPVRQRRYER
jgi:hypothetical protein